MKTLPVTYNYVINQHFDFSGIIDEALEECDINNDGYLSYSEFKAGRARAYARGAESDEI